MVRAVDEVLEEIGAGSNPRLLVLNKADLIDAAEREELRFRHPDGVLVSAETGEGLDELREHIRRAFAPTLRSVELLVPYGDGALLPELHAAAGDLQREETADGVRVVARLPAALVSRYERFAVNGRNGDDS
jgi:GTP-binding protein HflX